MLSKVLSRAAILCLLAYSVVLSEGADFTYNIGVGRYDVTGPATEVEMVIAHYIVHHFN